MPVKTKTPCRKCKRAHSNSNGYCDQHQDLATNWGEYQKRLGRQANRRYKSKEYLRNREIIKRLANGLCEHCTKLGRVTEGTECDHKVPRSRGGSDDVSNLQWLCKSCHARKTAQEGGGARGEGRVKSL
ncbi:HNH endonuclease [Microbulbifer salipaludis]|uniref:HNH endonuclease n=1 Tax=Microbulbifer salipaludis TaxID=187980 RepID=A0ABS3E947_9GAMM|nr:HNH endonuclease [Microbulbifer salipaludis]